MVERAAPGQQRKALEIANVLVKAGIGFVPVPVGSGAEFDKLMHEALAKLAELEQEAAADSPAGAQGQDNG